MIKEFKKFAMRGNVIDMAIGIIIGTAFGNIINSLVKDIIMPPIGFILAGVDFSKLSIILKNKNTAVEEISINYGIFINAIINFIIIAFILFIIVRVLSHFKVKEDIIISEVTQKECPRCYSTISIKATRCPNCTSEI